MLPSVMYAVVFLERGGKTLKFFRSSTTTCVKQCFPVKCPYHHYVEEATYKYLGVECGTRWEHSSHCMAGFKSPHNERENQSI